MSTQPNTLLNPNVVINAAKASILSYLKKQNGGTYMCEDDINEVICEVNFKVYSSDHTYDPNKSKLSTWVSRIAYTTLIDFLGKRNCRGRKIYGDDMNWERSLLDAGYSDAYDVAEAIGHLKSYSSSLTNKRRTIFDLLARGFSNKEIAEICDMSQNAVNACICHMRKDLRSKFSDIDSLYSSCKYAV